jgi:exodeoxyribonuclease VII small subunit
MAQTKTLEMVMKELEGILESMDDEGISLEESFQLYKKGIQLCKSCNEKIDKVEKQLEIIGEQ